MHRSDPEPQHPADGASRPGEQSAADGVPGGRRAPTGWAWGGAPVVLQVVAVVVLLQAVGLAAVAGWGITQLVAGTEPNLGVGIFMVLFALGVAAVLVTSARALLAGRRSGRAPIATWQLLQGATAFALGSATGLAGAWAVLAMSAVVFVLLMTKPAVAHVVGARPRG